MERVLHSSLAEAAPHVGYRIENPSGGQTRTVAGNELPTSFGPLDNGATYVDWNSTNRFGLAVEAKNIREWIYPWSSDLYQLLVKSCVLQSGAANVTILPVLVCRRAHPTTFRMAHDLGFHVIATRRQYILPSYFKSDQDERYLNEVRAELAFYDLTPRSGPDEVIVKQFKEIIPERVKSASLRWARFGSSFELHYRVMRDSDRPSDKRTALEVLRTATANLQADESDIVMGW